MAKISDFCHKYLQDFGASWSKTLQITTNLIGHGWPIKHRKVFERRLKKAPFRGFFQAWSRSKKLTNEFFTTNALDYETGQFMATAPVLPNHHLPKFWLKTALISCRSAIASFFAILAILPVV